MAWQPIHMPQVGPAVGEDLYRAMTDARDFKLRKNRERADFVKSQFDRSRLEQNDFQNAYLKASELARAGDFEGAKALLGRYGATLEEVEQKAAAAGLTAGGQGAATPTQAPPAAPTVPDAPDGGWFGGAERARAMGGQAAQPIEPPPQMDAQAQAPAAAPPAQPQPTGNPIMDARQTQQARRNQVLRARFGGQEFTIDPEAGRAAREQRFDQVFASVEDPEIQGMYRQIRPMIMAAREEIDPGKLYNYFHDRMMTARAAVADKAREEARLAAEAKRDERQEKQLQQSNTNSERSLQGMLALAAGRSRQADQGDQRIELATETAAQTATREVLGQFGFRATQEKFQKFNQMAEQFSQKNAALDAATAGSWVKEAQGGSGVISDADMNAFWDRIGSAAERTGEWIAKILSGKSSDPIRQKVVEAVRWLANYNRDKLKNARSALEFRLDSPNLRPYKDTMVGTFFPETRNKITDSRAIEAARNKTRAGRVKGGGKDALDRDMEGL